MPDEKTFRTNLILTTDELQMVLELMAWTMTPTKNEMMVKALKYYHEQLKRKEHERNKKQT